MTLSREHPATQPLRERSARSWHELLLAALVDFEGEWLRDPRDLMMFMAPFHHCASRIGLATADSFAAVAAAGPESLRELVAGFGARTDVTPAAFAFELRDAPEGPAYVITF